MSQDRTPEAQVIDAAIGSLDPQQRATLQEVLEAEAQLPAETFDLLLKFAIQKDFRIEGLAALLVAETNKQRVKDATQTLLDRMLTASTIAKNLDGTTGPNNV